MKPKKLVFDIESSPLRVRTWGLREQDAIWVEKDWELLSIAIKPIGGKAQFFGRNNYSEEELVKMMWQYFDEYDVLIGHNIKKFDIKKMNAKFIEYNLLPPSPYAVEDTLQMFRSVASFSSNRLGDLAEKLGVTKKKETGGYKLWKDCENMEQIDEKAWKKMEIYNKGDCITNEKIYFRILPWAKSPVLHFGRDCPYCGGKSQSRGPAMKPNHHRYQCKSCYKWFQRKV